jgi:predicted DNA-binding transcriptional regulator YafY
VRLGRAGRAPIPPERLARALSLLSYLLEGHASDRVPLVAIRNDLGLEPTEVAEDLVLLNYANSGGGTYIIYACIDGDDVVVDRWPEGEGMARPARLSPLMAKSLLLALELVGRQLPLGEEAMLAQIRAKVERLIAGLDVEGEVTLEEAAAPPDAVLNEINRALRLHLLLTLEYFVAARAEVRARIVEPYLLWQSGDAWYLEAYCRSAEAQRTFRLDSIRAAQALPEEFRPREDMDLAGLRTGISALGQEPRWAVLRMPASLGPSLRERGLEVSEMQEGDLTVRIPYLGDRWLVREVLRHGGDAALEEPERLRTEVARTARELMHLYGTQESR